ncbi:hypothetical protein D3C77_493360 [compost metagenome]
MQRLSGDRVERGQRWIPVQVRIDCHEAIEGRGNKPRECLGGYGLASLEASVLAHIGKVGRDQRHFARAERAGGVRGEDEAEETVIGPRERADEADHLVRDVGKDADIALAVGKAPGLDLAHLPPAGFG